MKTFCRFVVIASLAYLAGVAYTQMRDGALPMEQVSTRVGRLRFFEQADPFVHPFEAVARHPVPGCAVTAVCGKEFYWDRGHNIRVSAGTAWQSQLMGSTSAPTDPNQANYMGLTNTAVTPAMADTTLSGLITSNGLSCAQGTYTDGSGVVSVPGAATASTVGTAGSTTYVYWILALNQGIYTSVNAASNTLTTSNGTLSTTNYNQVTFTGVQGATGYALLRTTSGSAPSGTSTVLVSAPVAGGISCTAALACTGYDQSNTLSSVTIPASNLTNYGHFTLVHTWTATSSQSAQAFGVFTNSACTSNLRFEGVFTPVSLNANDTFQLTETIAF